MENWLQETLYQSNLYKYCNSFINSKIFQYIYLYNTGKPTMLIQCSLLYYIYEEHFISELNNCILPEEMYWQTDQLATA